MFRNWGGSFYSLAVLIPGSSDWFEHCPMLCINTHTSKMSWRPCFTQSGASCTAHPFRCWSLCSQNSAGLPPLSLLPSCSRCVLLWSLGHLYLPPHKRTLKRECGTTFGSPKISDLSTALLCYRMQLETSMEKISVLLWCPRPSMKTWCVWPNGLRKWSSCKETEQILQHWLCVQLTITSVWTKKPSHIGQSCAHTPFWICFPQQF